MSGKFTAVRQMSGEFRVPGGWSPRQWMIQLKTLEKACTGGRKKPDIYKQFAGVKCFSMQVCCRVRPQSPPTGTPAVQKNLRICANLMTRHGWGRVGTCLPVATLRLHQWRNEFDSNQSTALLEKYRTSGLHVTISVHAQNFTIQKNLCSSRLFCTLATFLPEGRERCSPVHNGLRLSTPKVMATGKTTATPKITFFANC